MSDKKVRDITVEILKEIRDEIKKVKEEVASLRIEMNQRFELVDKRFEQMDKRFARIEADIKSIVVHFDRDYMTLANKMGEVEGRLNAHLQESAHHN